ncbi:SAM-dependent methyltransferase [Microbacterium sp. M3]|uniref:SAM-dependent methyltransferase n=1 Tax=Microbacterium arthrosphaerae TaxID=792652 RepID=A0ABU4GXM7_9MICO|nr:MULTISPECIES: methyltransferase domain-containing protein [Microbacterium]MDW4571199.1 SAM-dependent methyltransferase [Microbacterium arthrosphaerae]MDW7605054.1 SAM-dependent methyltransferase [Microbacterium sp. M3]
MDECCAPPPADGFDREFDARFAARLARRYRREGLTPSAHLILDFADSVGLDGASVLEIGGGIGDIQLEALKRGAARTTNVELSSSYEPIAAELLDEAGLRDRVTRVLGVDVARAPAAVDVADIVVLHRVVCCYPDYRRLLGAAAARGRRAVVFSHPGHTLWTRIASRSINALYTLTGNPYRSFAHDPRAMEAVLVGHGFAPRYHERRGPWHVVGAVRA